MQSILDAINEWIKGILLGAINGNLSTMFGDVNEKVGTIAAEVGKTPQGWNGSIFSMIRTLSENVIVPIAGLVITYARHYGRVRDKELAADTFRLMYEYGARDIPARQYFDGSPDPVLGKFQGYEALPNDPAALEDLLREERQLRQQLSPGDFKAHIAALHDGLIETEARRITGEMRRQYAPNSPDKSHFMTELSPAFMQLASSKDTDRLFSMLPYKSLSFSKIEGRHGIYALIDKNENRDKDIRRVRPSIRTQLAADKGKTAPKKAAAKSKQHDMEV